MFADEKGIFCDVDENVSFERNLSNEGNFLFLAISSTILTEIRGVEIWYFLAHFHLCHGLWPDRIWHEEKIQPPMWKNWKIQVGEKMLVRTEMKYKDP